MDNKSSPTSDPIDAPVVEEKEVLNEQGNGAMETEGEEENDENVEQPTEPEDEVEDKKQDAEETTITVAEAEQGLSLKEKRLADAKVTSWMW